MRPTALTDPAVPQTPATEERETLEISRESFLSAVRVRSHLRAGRIISFGAAQESAGGIRLK